MARPSKLTPPQWTELERRALKGERACDLSVEFGISETVICRRVSQLRKKANSIIKQIDSLPVTAARFAIQTAEQNLGTRQNVEIIAKEGTAVAAHLAQLARKRVEPMQELPPAEELRDVAAAAQVMAAIGSVGVAAQSKNLGQPPGEKPDNTSSKAELMRKLERLGL